jgi:hypothetical protein
MAKASSAQNRELAMRQEGACFFYQKRYYAAYQKIHEAG